MIALNLYFPTHTLCEFLRKFRYLSLIHILLIDYYSERVDVLKLSFLQFLLAGILSAAVAAFAETIDWNAIIDCAVPILYTAILEVSVAFTLQIAGQKSTPPAVAAVIMSLESLFSAVCGALFLGEVMSGREITGCVLMLIAFIVAQIPEARKNEQKVRS